jgi:hypothetical protein
MLVFNKNLVIGVAAVVAAVIAISIYVYVGEPAPEQTAA